MIVFLLCLKNTKEGALSQHCGLKKINSMTKRLFFQHNFRLQFTCFAGKNGIGEKCIAITQV